MVLDVKACADEYRRSPTDCQLSFLSQRMFLYSCSVDQSGCHPGGRSPSAWVFMAVGGRAVQECSGSARDVGWCQPLSWGEPLGKDTVKMAELACKYLEVAVQDIRKCGRLWLVLWVTRALWQTPAGMVGSRADVDVPRGKGFTGLLCTPGVAVCQCPPSLSVRQGHGPRFSIPCLLCLSILRADCG